MSRDELIEKLQDILAEARTKQGTCPAHSKFLICAESVYKIATKLSAAMKQEEHDLNKIGVGWASAFSKAYRHSEECLKIVEDEFKGKLVVEEPIQATAVEANPEAAIAESLLQGGQNQ